MGTWKNAVEQVSATAVQGANLAVSSFEQLVRNIAGGAGGVAGSIWNSGSTVVGINVGQIPDMQAAIDNYVKGLTDHLSQINSQLDTDTAFKGQYAAEVTNYVQAVTTACQNVVSQLKAFDDELTKVQEAYTEYDKQLSQSIQGSSEEVSQGSQAYTGSEQA